MRLEAAATSATPSPVRAASASQTPLDLGIEWDAENRLQAVKQGGNTLASFTYDGSGRRSTKTAGGTTTTYVYDGPQFLEERPSGGSTRRYVYSPGIDRPLAQSIGGVTSYFVADHLGSVVRATDVSGAPTLTREYDPWGSLLQGSATGGYAYTGREWDSETGLFYYRARYYDPRVGRFLSEDPLDARGARNRFVYAQSNPINNFDPSGLVAWKCTITVVTFTRGLGGGYGWADCESKKCCNGRKLVVLARLAFFALSSSPLFVGGTVSAYDLEDHLPYVSKLNLAGAFGMNGFGTAFGPWGYGCYAVTLGAAGGAACSAQGGGDVPSIDAIGGASVVTSARWEPCCQ